MTFDPLEIAAIENERQAISKPSVQLEIRCDEFARKLGYGCALYSALKKDLREKLIPANKVSEFEKRVALLKPNSGCLPGSSLFSTD